MGIMHSTASDISSLGSTQKQSVRIGVITSMDTVLIVEDSRPMQRTLQRLFESDSLQVQIASDGPTGLELFRKQLPCVVVLDLKLPGISGKELCREFKTIAASVPIVVLSANAEVEDKVLLLELGADTMLPSRSAPKSSWLASVGPCAAPATLNRCSHKWPPRPSPARSLPSGTLASISPAWKRPAPAKP